MTTIQFMSKKNKLREFKVHMNSFYLDHIKAAEEVLVEAKREPDAELKIKLETAANTQKITTQTLQAMYLVAAKKYLD